MGFILKGHNMYTVITQDMLNKLDATLINESSHFTIYNNNIETVLIKDMEEARKIIAYLYMLSISCNS